MARIDKLEENINDIKEELAKLKIALVEKNADTILRLSDDIEDKIAACEKRLQSSIKKLDGIYYLIIGTIVLALIKPILQIIEHLFK